MIIKAVIFDLDGLLIDSEPLHMKAWQQTAESEGFLIRDEEMERFVGVGNQVVADYVASKSSRKSLPIEVQARKTERFLELLRSIKTMPGVNEIISKLHRNHIRLGVVSGSPRSEVISALQFASIYKHFDVIVTGSDVRMPKPAPEGYRNAMRKLNVTHAECVAFEDSSTGVAASKNAGIFTIAIPHKLSEKQDLSRADLLLDSLSVLTDATAQLIAKKNPVLGKLIG